MNNYEAGLAQGRQEGAVAVVRLSERITAITADRDEWKKQHENLVAVREQDLKALAADVEHYKQRLRALLPYARHTNECAYSKWRLAEFLQKSYGNDYSAGPMPACTCGFAALGMIVHAEVGERPAPVESPDIKQDVDRWKRELLAAGWAEARHDLYRSPGGLLYLGPYKAWQVMQGHA